MVDEVINEWKKILKEYITKRFAPNPKENFIAFLKEETQINFSKRKSYEALFHEIEEKIGKDRFFSILGIRDIEEAGIRTLLADVFNALSESPGHRQLTPLYTRLTGEKVKIKHKADKKKPAYELAFSINESDFIKAWITLCKEENLPEFYHNNNLTIGPLGWIKISERGEKDMFGLNWDGHPELVDLIKAKFGQASEDIIINALLDVIKQVGKNPEQFGFTEKESYMAYKYLEQIKSEDDDFVSSIKRLQLFCTYLTDNDLLDILNKFIANGKIVPKIQGLYDIYYSSYDLIITRYGLFKRPDYSEREPNKALCEFLQKELSQKDLELELGNYQGIYPLNLFAYCIKENPEYVMDRLFGVPQLRNIAANFEMRALKHKRER